MADTSKPNKSFRRQRTVDFDETYRGFKSLSDRTYLVQDDIYDESANSTNWDKVFKHMIIPKPNNSPISSDER